MRVTFPLIPAAYTSTVFVQVSGFEDLRLLTHCDRLLCDSCSSGQCFAFGFLQIPPRDGHPCRSANRSPCRADSGLAPPSHPATTTCTGTAPVKALRAMPGARRVGDRNPCPPHQTVHTVFPYTAFRCASCQGMRPPPGSRRRKFEQTITLIQYLAGKPLVALTPLSHLVPFP